MYTFWLTTAVDPAQETIATKVRSTSDVSMRRVGLFSNRDLGVACTSCPGPVDSGGNRHVWMQRTSSVRCWAECTAMETLHGFVDGNAQLTRSEGGGLSSRRSGTRKRLESWSCSPRWLRIVHVVKPYHARCPFHHESCARSVARRQSGAQGQYEPKASVVLPASISVRSMPSTSPLHVPLRHVAGTPGAVASEIHGPPRAFRCKC